ncbi:hypothetical protein V3481_012116 [Fusarium oxysporum f. sp. vasinfectum]
MRLFSVLENIIKLERESGQVIRGRYYRDSSVALDIYMSAQDDASDLYCLRRRLKERKRAGRSWRDLSKPSPLLVLMYSDAAERIVKDFKKVDAVTLRLVAAKILEQCPAEILHFCETE